MEDIGAAELVIEVLVDHFQQVIGLALGDCHFRRVASVFAVGGADQGEAFQVWNGEDNALIFILQNVGMFAFV
ncbi:hypothetical protein D3C76_1365840 [compost metagenome]